MLEKESGIKAVHGILHISTEEWQTDAALESPASRVESFPSAVQGFQMANFDPFLSLDCARVEGGGRNPRKGRDQILQRSVAEP